MQILSWNNKKDIKSLVASVLKNELFVGTTDTVLGIMGNVSPLARERIDKAKVRVEKPYVVLVDTFCKVEWLCGIDVASTHSFLKQCWPGPVTVILKVKPELQQRFGVNGTVAVRIPNHQGLQQLLGDLPYGLYSTSANISGQPVPGVIDQVDQSIKDSAVYYIADEHVASQPSTIIDCSDNSFKVVREGLYPIETLRQMYYAALH